MLSLLWSLLALQPAAPPPPAPVRVTPVPFPFPKPVAESAERNAQRERMVACQRAYYGQTYLPQPALYRVADSDTQLYLLGSIHRLPASFDWRTPQLDDIARSSDKLITEAGTEILPGGPDPFDMLKGGKKDEPRSHPPLAERLTGERLAKWQGMNVFGPSFVMNWIDRQPDWRVATSIMAMLTRFGSTGLSDGVEDQLRREFHSARKPIEGLERGKDVLASLNGISPSLQRAMLEQSFDLIGKTDRDDSSREMFHHWARGEQVPVDPGFPPELRELLLDRRNAAWVPVIATHLGPPGTRLVVVGAGHLYGRNNLLELLAAAGMKAQRMSRTKPPLPRPAFTPHPKSLAECQAYLPPPSPARVN